jgi:hypothetical protein
MFYSDVAEAALQKGANKLVSEIFVLLWSIGLGITYPLICIGWLGIVLKAQNLGVDPVGLKRYRLAAFIILCIILPIYAILLMIPFGLKRTAATADFLDYVPIISRSIDLLYILFLLLGTSVLTIKLYVWARRHASNQTMAKIARKTLYLTIANVALLALFIDLALVLAIEDSTLDSDLSLDLINCLIDAVSGIAFFLFLENYFLKYGFLRGYYLGFIGRVNATHSAESPPRSRFSASNKTPKTITVKGTNHNNISSGGSVFTLNAASSAASTATSQTAPSSDGLKDTGSRVTHNSYETSPYDTTSSSSSSSVSFINPIPKPEGETVPPPKEEEGGPSDSQSIAEFEDSAEMSGSQSSFIVKLFKGHSSLWT